MNPAPDIPGAAEVVAWFGYWPAFHDAEVLSIALNRSGASQVAIYTFETTRDVDPSGHYILVKPAMITFRLEGFPQDQQGIVNTRLEFFNHQNVLNGVSVRPIAGGYELILEGIYGVSGSLCCERLSVALEPMEARV
jgi:hypothetical protein